MTPGPPKPAAPAHDPCSLPTWGLRVGGWQPVQSIDSSIGTLKNCLSFLSCSFTCIFTCICTYVYTLSSRLCKNTYRHTENTFTIIHTCPRAHTHTDTHRLIHADTQICTSHRYCSSQEAWGHPVLEAKGDAQAHPPDSRVGW